jgi:hypothetical protein
VLLFDESPLLLIPHLWVTADRLMAQQEEEGKEVHGSTTDRIYRVWSLHAGLPNAHGGEMQEKRVLWHPKRCQGFFWGHFSMRAFYARDSN